MGGAGVAKMHWSDAPRDVSRKWDWVLGRALGAGRHAWHRGQCPVSHCTVPEVTIVEALQDVQLSEGQDAHFRCQLSRASGQEAHWALGGVPLKANEMNDITVEHGTLHLLTLHKVTLEDAGTISFQVGSCSSEAQLKVTGGQLAPITSCVPEGHSSTLPSTHPFTTHFSVYIHISTF